MYNKIKYWFFSKVIPERICDDIKRQALQNKFETALTGNVTKEKTDIKELNKTRDSDIVWLTHNWIYKELEPIIQTANRNAGWNYETTSMEAAQFTQYKPPHQHYSWHMDAFEEPFSNPENKFTYKKIRKLSLVLLLSKPYEYEGGGFEFDFSNKDEGEKVINVKELIGKGSLIVFPSFQWHRVKPVTKGIRHSLVMWTLGNPWL